MRLIHPVIGPLFVEAGDKIYIVSDLHLNHHKEFLWGSRSGFMNKDNNWVEFNDHVEYTDYVLNELDTLANYHKDRNEKAYLISLGDTCLTDKDAIYFTKFASLPFERIFALGGNHCSGANTIFALNHNMVDFHNLTIIGSNISLRYKKKHICLSHYPILDWDQITYGVLCGHCHGNNKVLNPGNSEYGRLLDCGVDNAINLYGRVYFTLEECMDILRAKDNFNPLIQFHRVY